MTRSERPHESLRRCMLHRERGVIFRALGSLLLASPGILLDNVMLSGIVWLLGPYQHHVPWHRVFWWSIAATVLVFWCIDLLTPKSDVLGDAMSGSTGMTTAGGHMALGPGNRGAGGDVWDPILADLLLLGPRQLRKAVGRLWTAWGFRRANRDRAEQLLRQLVTLDHGPAVQSLFQPHEQLAALWPVVAYLEFYGWIDVSQDAQRVWLSSGSRSVLENAV